MQRMASLALLALILSLFGSGCQTYTAQTRTMENAWTSGQPAAAAAAFGKEADDCGDSKDAIVWNLEAGAAYRVAGNLPESFRHFDKAGERIDVYEQQSKTKVGREALAIMSTPQNMPYEGRSYDKIMLHTYEALNFLTQGDVEKAIRTAQAIGDDRLQTAGRGYAVPDSFTHGSSAQRAKWLTTGLKSGQIEACDTFSQ